MKIKFFALLLFVTLGTLSAIAQTESKVTKDTPQELPGGIRPDQIYSGKTKIPSNAKVKKFPNSAAVTTPIKTPSPALATGYMVKEKNQQEVNDRAYSYVFILLGVLFTVALVLVIFFGNHRRKKRARRQRVVEYKNNKLKDEACRGTSGRLETHDNHGPFVTH